jgi:hypothetical protein
VAMKMAVFWVVALCFKRSVLPPSSGRRVTHRPDDGGSTDLWNVGKPVPVYTALQPRRQPSSTTVFYEFSSSSVPGCISLICWQVRSNLIFRRFSKQCYITILSWILIARQNHTDVSCQKYANTILQLYRSCMSWLQ